MSEIENRIVEMKFNHDDFSRGVQATLQDLKKLDEGLKLQDAGKGLSGLQKAANGLDLSHIAESVDAINDRFAFMQSFAGRVLGNIKSQAANWATSMAKSLSIDQITGGFKEYELKMGSVQTIMAGSGASMEEVNKYLEELNAYSDKTIYSFSDMTSSIGKFTNAGVKLDDAVKAIQGISNEAARSGANAQQASAAMYNFSQALSSGAVKLIDWKSIENAQMATVEFKQSLLDTAVALGTVRKEGDAYISTTTDANGHVSDAFTATSMFNDSLSSLWMTSDVLTQTLANYSTDVREMTQEEYEAWKSKMIGLGYTEEQVKSIEELGKASFDAAQDVKSYSMMMDALQEAIGSGWATTFELIFGNLEEAKELWTGLNNVLSGTIGAIGEVRNGILKVWKARGGRDDMIAGISALWRSFTDLVKPIGEALDYFLPSINVLGIKLANLSHSFMMAAGSIRISDEFATDIRDTFKMLIFPIATIGKLVGSVFGAVVPTALKLVGSILRAIFTITGNMARTFQSLFSPVEKFTKTFGKASKQFVKFFEKDIVTFPNALAQTLVNLGATAEKFIVGTFDKVKNTVIPFFVKLSVIFDKFKRSVQNIVRDSGLGDFIDWIVQWNSITGQMIGSFFTNVIPDTISGTASALAEFGKSAIEAFRGSSSIGEFVKNLKKPFEDLKAKLDEVFMWEDGFFGAISSIFGHLIPAGSIKDLKEMFSYFKVDVPKIVQGVKGALNILNADLYRLTGINFKAVGQDIGHFFSVIGSSIEQATRGYRQAFATFGQDIKAAIMDNGFAEWFDFILYWADHIAMCLDGIFGHEGGLYLFLKALKSPLQDLGNGLVDAFKNASSITDFLDRCRTAVIKFKDAVVSLFNGGFSVGDMSDRIKHLLNYFQMLFIVLKDGFAHFVDTKKLISDVGAAFGKLGRSLLELLHLDGVFDSLSQLKIFSDLRGDLSRLLDVVKEFFQTNILGRVSSLVDGVKEKFSGIREYFEKNLNFGQIFEDVGLGFKWLTGRLSYLLGEGWNPHEIFDNLKKLFGQFFKIIGKSIKENINLGGILGDIQSWFSKIRDSVKDFITLGLPGMIGKIKDKVKELWDNLSGGAKDIGSGALGKVKDLASQLPDIFKDAKEKVGEFFDKIANSNVIKSVQSVFEPMIDWVKNSRAAQGLGFIFDKIKETFTTLKGSAGEGFTAFLDKIKNFKFDSSTLTALLDKIKEFFGYVKTVSTDKFVEIRTKLGEFVDMLKEKVGPAKDRMLELKDSLMGTFEDILDKFKNFDWTPVFDIVKGAAAIYAFYKIIQAIDSFTSAATIVSTIKGMFSDIGKAAKATKWTLIADAFLKAGIAIAILAGSLVVLSSINQDNLMNATSAIAIILILMSLFVGALALFKKFSGASAAAEASAKDSKKGAKALESIKEGLGKFLDSVSETFSNFLKKLGNAAILIGSVIAIVFAIVAVIRSFKQIQKIASQPNFGTAIVVLLGIVVVLGIFIKVVSMGQQMSIGSALGIFALGTAIIKVVKAFRMMNKIVGNENFDKAQKAMWGIVGMLSVLLLATSFSKKADKNIKAFGVTAILMAIAFKLIAKPLQELTKVAGAGGNKFKGVAIGLGILLGVMALAIGIFAKLGASAIEENMKGFITGLAGLVVVAGVIWIFADAMKQLDSLDHVWRSLGVIVIGLVAIAAALAGFGAIAQIFAPGLLILTKVMTGFGIAVALVGAGMALFGLGVQLAAAAFPAFGEGIVQMANDIQGHEDEVVNAIGVIIAGIVKGILDGLGLLVGAIISGLDTVVVELDKYLPSFLDHLLVLLGHVTVILVDRLADAFVWLWNCIPPKLKEFFGKLWSEVADRLGDWWTVFVAWQKTNITYIQQFFSTIGGYCKAAVANFMAMIAEAVANNPVLSKMFELLGVDVKTWAENARADADAAVAHISEIEAQYEAKREAIHAEVKAKQDAEAQAEWEQHKADEEAKAAEDIARIQAKYDKQAQVASDGTHAATAAVNQAMAEDADGTEESASIFGINVGGALGEGLMGQLTSMMNNGADSQEMLAMLQSSGVDMGDSSLSGIVEALQNGNMDVVSEYINLGEDSADEFGDNQDLEGAAEDNMDAAATSVNQNNSVTNAAGNAGRRSGEEFGRAGYGSYYASGSHSMDGGAAGIDDNTYKVTAAARRAARAANDAYNAESQIKSPSRKFKESGMYQMLGAAVGIADNTHYLVENSVSAAKAAIGAFSDTLHFDTSGAGYRPHISPVLDMSSFSAGSGAINGFFDRTANVQANINTSGLNFRDSINTFSRADIRRGDETVNVMRQLNDAISDLGNRIERMEVKLNDGTLVGKITAPLDQSLGRRAALKARGM